MEEEVKKTEANYDLDEVREYGALYVEFVKEVRGVDVTYYGNWQRDFAKLLIELSDLKSNPDKEWETVLDVGCGTGLNIRAIDELGIFSNLYALDHSQYLIDLAQRLYDFGSSFKFFVQPASELSGIEDNEIDLLISTHVLEHLPDENDLKYAMEEFKRVLHPKGKILIIIPCTEEENQTDDSPLHYLMHTSKWWTKLFGTYFKSESFKARQLFKKTELRPDRNDDKSFSDVYQSWNIFRLVHK